MSFKISNNLNYSVITSEEEKLDTFNSPELKEIILNLNKNSVNNIIINLSKTLYCNSSGLSAILSANRLCKNSNGRFILTGLQPNVRKMIEIAQLHRVFTITDTIEQAEKAMS